MNTSSISLTTDMKDDGIHVFHGKQKIAVIKNSASALKWRVWAELNDPIQSPLINTGYASLQAAEYAILAYAYELREAFEAQAEVFNEDDLASSIVFNIGNDTEVVICQTHKEQYRVDMLTDGGNNVHWSLEFSHPQYAWTELKRWVK